MATPSQNIFWLSLSRTIAIALLAVAYIFLLRYLGPHGTGQHQFVLSFTTIFGVIIDFGLQQFIIKKISEEPTRAKYYLQNFFAVEVVLATVVYALMMAIAFGNGYEPVVMGAIAVSGLGFVFAGLTYPYLAVMSAHQDLKKVALINFMNSMVNVVIITLTIVLGKYIVFLVSNQLIFGIIGLFLYRRFVRVYIPRAEIWNAFRYFDFGFAKQIMRAALPFALLVGFSTIYNRIDMVIIYKMLGAEATGLYASAYRFFDLVAFFPSIVSFTLYPVFAGLVAKGQISEVRAIVEKYLRLLLALALPLAVGGMLLAKSIIFILAGEEFLGASSVLSVLIWAPAILLTYIVANALVISQLTKWAVVVTVINVVINIAANLILLPRYGIVAAASVTVASEFIQGALYFYFVKTKLTNFSFARFVWRPALAAAVMGVVVYFVQDSSIWQNWLDQVAQSFVRELANLIGMGVIGVTVYFVVLVLLNFWQKNDLVMIKKMLPFRQSV